MGHKVLQPVDVVLKTFNFLPFPEGQYSGIFNQFQRDILPTRRSEE